MIDAGFLRLLARYRSWADQSTYQAAAALPPAEPAKPRSTLFGSIIGTLNHICLIDLVWQAHLTGRPHGFTARNLVLHEDLAALETVQRQLNQWYEEWAEVQSPESFAERVDFTFISGKPGSMTRAEILLHVVNHATYHRGWLGDLFFQIPARLPPADLPDFLRAAVSR
jgi:uncharacterized damage-inducible protein DinB